MGLNIEETKAVERFRAQVVEPSMNSLVILDFWAEWCGPCKALTPVLEKVAADYADKGVVLAKVNVDEERFIADQFRVQSIPTVYAMFQGQPVADLTQARGEGQLKQMIDQLLEKLPIQPGGVAAAPDLTPLLALGEEALEDGENEKAGSIFVQILDQAPENMIAHAGLVRALIALGQVEEAESLLADLPEGMDKDPAIERARAALLLAKDKPADDELVALREAHQAAPEDMEAGFAYASGAFAAGQRDEAATVLLGMIAADRAWNDGAARTKLLQIFEVIGLEDPWVSATRRRLSTILFG